MSWKPQKGIFALRFLTKCIKIYAKITEELQEQGLEDSVTVKKTGCMGRCKSAPNLVVLPGKNCYKCFSEEEINSLIDTHFLAK